MGDTPCVNIEVNNNAIYLYKRCVPFFKLSDNKSSVLSDFLGFNLLMANLTYSTVIQ